MAQHLQPEQQAREQIDKMLAAAGWAVQDYDDANLSPPGGADLDEQVALCGWGVWRDLGAEAQLVYERRRVDGVANVCTVYAA